MPKRCYVEWCFSGYDSQNRGNRLDKKRNNTVFRAPKDPELRMKWHEAIGRKDKILSERDSICELHFKESDIIRFFETPMPDGTIHRIPRRCSLKPGAIPNRNIIEKFPPSLTKCEDIDKKSYVYSLTTTGNPAERVAQSEQKIKLVINPVVTQAEQSNVKAEIKENNNVPESSTASRSLLIPKTIENEILNMKNLQKGLLNHPLPQRWAYICVNGEIHFPHFNSKLVTDMTVTVKSDVTLSGKVSVPEGITRETDILNFTSFDNFVKSLTLLEKQRLCQGTGTNSKREDSCPIFIRHLPKFPFSVRSNRCLACRCLRHRELKSEHKREKSQKNRILEYQRTLCTVKQQNRRLKTRVIKLKAALDNAKKTVPISMTKLFKEKYLYCQNCKSKRDFKVPDNFMENLLTS